MSFRGLAPVLLSAVLALASLGIVSAQGLSPLEAEQPAAPTVPPPSNALDKKDLEFYVRHLAVYGPQINIEVGEPKPSGIPGLVEVEVQASYQLRSKVHRFLISEDGKHIIEGARYEVDKNPFHEINAAIQTESAPALGKEGASVVVAVYSDFQCPYCAQEAKIIHGNLSTEYGEKVRVYFRDFPLDTHSWAKQASVIGRCVHRQEPQAFWDYHDWIFENQAGITPENLVDKASAFALDKGLDGAKFTSCVANHETLAEVEASILEGQTIGVNSTPSVFVNGRKLGGTPQWPQLKAVIDYEIDYQKVTKNAGDNCGCEVELALPSAQ